ncbi:c-type cytochrome [Burkholderia semiarida]|uniref:c-type cytochrome n=1 Tax=Burkholderia TaxID=32008 RepID=UPI001CF2E50B|nr:MULTISPECIES: c-type cytochrome [Burkholderia]MCA8037229.1 c-type cytochrome [Burkholderia arboris]MDN7702641.1 c-type cytochrome [Burkholderia sp. AU44665]
MKKRVGLLGVVLVACAIALFWIVTSPRFWHAVKPVRDTVGSDTVDLRNGRTLFLAGDCATCHASPGGHRQTLLGGGRSLNTAFGTFRMPNISPDVHDGIGSWTLSQFVTAMREGVLPDKGNAYPAFPYTSYQHMSADDLRDLFAYLKTLPPVKGRQPAHDLRFPFTIRRGIGIWRLLFLSGKPLPVESGKSAAWLRGRYLVEGPAHCAECHSPRNFIGAIPGDKRFSGGPNAEGTGYVPNITPDETGIDYWTVDDIVAYLKDGVTPIGIRAGGDMKEVIENTSRLSDADRLAIATYIKALPAVSAPNPSLPQPNHSEQVVLLQKNADSASASRVGALAAAPTELAKTSTAYVVSTKRIYLDKPVNGAEPQEDGKLLPATQLGVIARDGDWLQVRVHGWQSQGTESVLYARRGQRIMEAVLSDRAVAHIVSRGSERDPDTGQSWKQGELTVWTRSDGLGTNLGQIWRYSDDLMAHTCTVCHARPDSGDFLANQWIGTLGAMRHFTSLDDDQYRLLLAWLQYHAKDAGAETGQGAR